MQHVKFSISTRLLIAFLSIVALSLIAFMFAIGALNDTRISQKRLTEQTLPVLQTSQYLSQSVFEYISALESLAATHSPGSSQRIRDHIQAIKSSVKDNYDKLKTFDADYNTTQHIRTLIDGLFIDADTLQALTLDKRPPLQMQTMERLQQTQTVINNTRMQLKHHRITDRSGNNSDSKAIKKITSLIADLEEYIGRYNTAITLDELQHYRMRYGDAVRSISLQLQYVSSPTLKKALAEHVDSLLSEIVATDGFFSVARDLAHNVSETDSAYASQRDKEKNLNLALGALLKHASVAASTDLAVFNTVIDNGLLLLFIVMGVASAVSVGIVLLYIIPFITKRLNRLVYDTERIAQRDYSHDIAIGGTDEISDMSHALQTFKDSMIAKEKADITIRENETRLRNIVENAVDGIITMNTQGIIQTFNPACEHIFGHNESDIRGKSMNIVMRLPRSDGYSGDFDCATIRTIIGEGCELQGIHADGREFPLDLAISEVDLNGSIFFTGIVRDISERKQNEEDRELLIDKLTQSNEQLERFAFICSHDLQEPLRMIRSFSDKLQHHMGSRLDDDERGKRYFSFVIDGAARAQQLVADILAYSSVDSITESHDKIDLTSIIESISTSITLANDDHVSRVTYDALPIINGQKTQIYQLFQNLIHNGLKYHADDVSPFVHVGAEDIGTHWQFSIKDNGIGIAEHHFDRIFDVFQRLHRDSEFSGTGVGLAICKKVVERHNGSIWLTSEKNKGTVFYFTILK